VVQKTERRKIFSASEGYKDLKIPEVGGRGTSAKQPIGNINLTLPFFCLYKFKALALRSLGEIMLEAKEILCDCIMH